MVRPKKENYLNQIGSMKYLIEDGRGNSYIFDDIKGKNRIEFSPKKRSNTSWEEYYSGPFSKKLLNNAEYNKIISVLNEAIRDTANHLERRVKGSGQIICYEQNEQKEYAIAGKSEILNKIIKILQDIVNDIEIDNIKCPSCKRYLIEEKELRKDTSFESTRFYSCGHCYDPDFRVSEKVAQIAEYSKFGRVIKRTNLGLIESDELYRITKKGEWVEL